MAQRHEPKAVYINPYDKDLNRTIKSIPRISGYCFMLDIVGSTEAKHRHHAEWIKKYARTFARAGFELPIWEHPVKYVGDMIMYFIPEDGDTVTALDLFEGLCGPVARKSAGESRIYLDMKAGAAYCSECLALTFKDRGDFDVYGEEIDLTARCLSLASPFEIVMNEAFRCRIEAEYSRLDDEYKTRYPNVERIEGPWTFSIKGMRRPCPLYKVAPHVPIPFCR